jgi:lipopolysaccharide transport system permease protein
VIVVSSVITSFVDFLISSIFLLGLLLWYHRMPPLAVWTLPLFVLLAFVASLGVGLWIAALMVEYRDFRYIVPFIVQIGLYISPVGFQSSVVPSRYRLLFSMNPMVGIIDGFRWSLLGTHVNGQWIAIAVSVSIVGFLLLTGIWYFRKTERTFADVI